MPVMSTMRYFVSLEDGEIVKMTPQGFEPTGMFMVGLPARVPSYRCVVGQAEAMADT